MSKINEMIRKEIKSWVKGHGWAPYKFSINNKGDLITGRAIFIHHINNEIPSFVEELYNIYLIFEEMIDEYYDWHSKTFGDLYEINWINLKLFSHEFYDCEKVITNLTELMESYNIYDEWMYDTIIINFFLWNTKEILRKENILIYPDILEYIYNVDIFKNIVDPEFYNGLGGIVSDVLEINNKKPEYLYYSPILRPFNPNIENRGDYHKYADEEIDKYLDSIVLDLDERKYKKAHENKLDTKRIEFDSEYKWAVIHHIKGYTYQKIYEDKIIPLELDGKTNLPNTNHMKVMVNKAVKKIRFSIKKPIPKNAKSRFSEKVKKELSQIWD
jgi:hypothetical protein